MEDLVKRDIRVVWHPFTQMKTAGLPIPIMRAKDAWLYATDGKKYLDVNSSWWTVLHGHGNEHLAKAIYNQFVELDHVIFAGVTHPRAVELSERILALFEGHYQRVFFSDNGSTSVEVALKMVYQFWYNQGKTKKRFLALEGAYHGDTFGAMSVGQRGYFNKPFEHLFFEVDYLDFPTEDNSAETLRLLESLFKSGEFAGFIFEPLVQGAAGMRMYQPAWLDAALALAKKYNVLTVADEVMTGFYRTGTSFAMFQTQSRADITCLSKGLTGGVMPLGLTLATGQLFDAFLSDDTTKALLHGHSFTGNALACAVACASLDLCEAASFQDNIRRISDQHKEFVSAQQHNPSFRAVRSLGTILAIEFETGSASTYFSDFRNTAYKFFIDRGFLIRPLGNIVFINAPYCIQESELNLIYEVILELAQMLKSEVK